MKAEIDGLFISKNDIDLGSMIRDASRKHNCNIMYASSGGDIISFAMNIKYGIIFVGEDCYKYYDLLADFMELPYFANICMVFITEDQAGKEYEVTNNNIYIIAREHIYTAMNDIVSRALMLYRNIDNKINYNKLSKSLTDYLIKLGFTQKYVGFQYIKDAVLTAVERNKNVSSYNKEIYPLVAIKNGTQVSNIEKSIRLSIKAASKVDNECFRECNFVSEDYISNKLFLSHLIDKLKYEIALDIEVI